MKNYKYFTFRNYVALNVVDDMFFTYPIGFWLNMRIRELQEMKHSGMPDVPIIPPRSDLINYRKLIARLTPAAVEKSLQELLPFMEEGLVVIGNQNDFTEKTSYGYFAITVPKGTIYDAIQAAREDFAKDKDDICQLTWMIQATTKGWEWANRQIALMDNAEYHKEKADFFAESS